MLALLAATVAMGGAPLRAQEGAPSAPADAPAPAPDDAAGTPLPPASEPPAETPVGPTAEPPAAPAGALGVAAAAVTPPPPPPVRTFYFPTRGVKDVTITFESNAPLETIIGITNKATGKFHYDPATQAGALEVIVDAATLRTGIDLRDEHLRGERWLDTVRHPRITYRATDISPVDGAPDRYRTTGAMTIRGISHEVAADVTARVVPHGDEIEGAGFGKGDVAHVRGEFTLRLSDYGILVPQADMLKVANTVTIRLDLFASTDPGRYRLVEETRQEADGAASLP